MSDFVGTTAETKKKRPPKLSPIVQITECEDLQSRPIVTKSSTSDRNDKNDLDSTVEVTLGNGRESILVCPDSLELVQQLGRGQYGIVEHVNHVASGNQFAVKRVALRPGDEEERKRLLMDVDVLAKSSGCKNIIKFYGALIWEGDLWIFMELMDCSLNRFYKLAHKRVSTPIPSSMIRRQLPLSTIDTPCSHIGPSIELGNCDACNPISEKVLGRMASSIVEALNYLYTIKVIHRDIKPSNILINQVGVIKLCDFGISGYLVNSVARTYEAGCRPYMAPERIDPPRDGTGYDIKSDIWSFGITMVEIATGRYPYQQARDFFEQLKRICSDEPPQLPEGRFSPIFVDFTRQCLRKDPHARPKYDTLADHDFIMRYKDIDIRDYTERILSGVS